VARLWEAIQNGDVEYCDDRHTLAALLRVVPVDMQAGLTNKEMAREAWEAICKIRVGANQVKEANAERLQQEFAKIMFKPGEGVEDFSLHISTLANELHILSDDITDEEVVKKMLHYVSEKLEQVAISMKTLLDLNTLSIEEATCHLRAVEQRRKHRSTSPAADASARLLLTEEEWMARMEPKSKDKTGSNGGSGSNGSGGNGGGRGRGRGRGRSHSGGRGGSADGAGRDTCYNCDKVGHWAHDCRSKAKKEEAHAAHDDESTLLLLEAGDVTVTEVSPSRTPTPPKTLSGTGEPVLPKGDEIDYIKFPKTLLYTAEIMLLVEDKVYAQFGEEEKECHRWVLDTSATNHMTGCRSAFSDLDRNIQGTVKFGDGSMVQIEGMGTILFSCKNGEHWAFIGVYYVPKLRTNIISVGQLDEIGYQIVVDGGVLKI
jgi:hypothetical protein